MRIKSIYIERFGCYRHYQTEQFLHPITVFFGPNEAGKSTLHAFIRFILYGNTERGEHPYRPVEGGEMGGYMEVEADGHLVRIARHTPPKKGRLFIEVDGRQESEPFLNQLLGHLPYHLFQTIFSFSHQELSQLNVLNQHELHHYLYAAAMGGGAINLLYLEQELVKKREGLFKPRGSKPLINQLLTSLRTTETEIGSLKEEMGQYSRLLQEKESIEEELARLRQKRLQREEKLEELRLLKQCFSLRKEREQLERKLSQLGSFNYLNYQQEIDQLKQKESLIKAQAEEVVRLDEQLRQVKWEINRQLETLGSPWQEDLHLAAKLTLDVKERLWPLANQLKKVEEEYERLSRELDDQKRKEALIKTQLEEEKRAKDNVHSASPPTLKRRNHFLSWLLAGGVLLVLLIPASVGSASSWLWLVHILLAVLLGAGWLYLERMQRRDRERLYKWEEEWRQTTLAHDRYLNNLQREWEHSRYTVKALEEKRDQLFSQLRTAQENWQTILAELGWPTFSPALLPELFSCLTQLNQSVAQEKQLQYEKNVRNEAIQHWCQQVAQLAAQMDGEQLEDGKPLSLEKASLHLNKLAEALKEEEKRAHLQEQLSNQLAELAEKEEELLQTLDWLGNQWENEASEHELNHSEEMLLRELESIQNQIELKATQLGRLEPKIDQLKTEERLTDSIQTFTEQKEELNQLARRYTVLALADQLLSKTRKIYEEQKQPDVLRKAGEYFYIMTRGRYTGLIAPLGENTLYVKDKMDRRWELTHLSQGTREQLYLALRFAFVKVFEQQVRLPLFLDDPLVNCDENRLKGILRGLAHLSESHQVFLFTCHPHILHAAEKIFQEKLQVIQLAEVQSLP